MNHIRSNRGTSLVEVLVVMVVLLIGIMSVVRIFPWGFQSVRAAENMTFAGRLAQFEIERWKNHAQNLPDGVLPVDRAYTILYDQYPGPPVKELPGNDNATTFRRVMGETTRIPFGGWNTSDPNGGSPYMLAFAPIDKPETIAVRGGNLSRRLIGSDDTSGVPAWESLRPYQYAIDYEAHKICFPNVNQRRIYYLSLSWWQKNPDTNGQELRSATSIPVEVLPGTHEWIDITTLHDGDGVPDWGDFINLEAYSDTVCRGFKNLVDLSVPWSSDPYELKLIDPVMGIILFNPIGYTQKEFGKSLEARIDYVIRDLQIIHEDKLVPNDYTGSANPSYKVHLTLTRLKQLDEEALCPPELPVDFLAVDLETCLPLKIETDPSTSADRLWKIDYKSGIVTLPKIVTTYDPANGHDVDSQVSPAGRNIRFFYKAEGDWSVQLMKAYSQYERANANSALTYCTYDVGYGKAERIWFAACNANHTVAVDYEYDDNGTIRKVVGEAHKTSDVLEDYRDQNNTPYRSTYIDLNHEPRMIYAVRGLSVKARVIWREGERWRNVDLDSVLTRQAAD